jgi:transcriptional regulator with XRE-family HTH domain
MEKDFLNEIIADRTQANPRFPELVDDAARRRAVAKVLAETREVKGLTQTVVAARMGTAASVVSKLESGGDVKLSTFQRYCAAIGQPFPLTSSLKLPATGLRAGASRSGRKARRPQSASETRRTCL